MSKNYNDHLSTQSQQNSLNSMKNINNNHHSSTTDLNKMKQQKQKINRLYEQNQKLAYRLNYLTDQNNFYKISINNIKKLNLNINKHLNANDNKRTNVKANFTGLSKQNTIHHNNHNNNNIDQDQNNSLQKQSYGPSQTKFKSRTLHRTSVQNNPNQKKSLFNKGLLIKDQKDQNTNPKDIVEPYSLISNKIHLKNLQIKVGNSIRKADKLKKLYEGSLSILNKKVDYLQNQINVLARQAEFYSIQNELLQNIYKADYYVTLNQEHKNQIFTQKNQNHQKPDQESQLQQIKQSVNCQIGVSNNFITQQEIQNLQNYIRTSKKKLTSKTTKSDKPNSNVQFMRKRPSIQQISKQKPAIKVQHKIDNKKLVQPVSKTNNNNKGIFLSGDPTKPRLKLKSGSNSACFHGKQSITNRINQLSRRALLKTTLKFNDIKPVQRNSQFQEIQSLGNINTNQENSFQKFNSSDKRQSNGTFDMKRNTREIYQLPQNTINQIIASLQNQEISQMNKLQSLRKQQKQQKKKRIQLIQKCEELNIQKLSIKSQIQSHFQHLTKTIKMEKGRNINLADIHQRQSDAFKLHEMNLIQSQLISQIQRQDKALQDQYKINQQYKQKIVDRNEQQSKQIKLLQQQVNKCLQQVRQVKIKHKDIVQQKKNKLKN